MLRARWWLGPFNTRNPKKKSPYFLSTLLLVGCLSEGFRLNVFLVWEVCKISLHCYFRRDQRKYQVLTVHLWWCLWDMSWTLSEYWKPEYALYRYALWKETVGAIFVSPPPSLSLFLSLPLSSFSVFCGERESERIPYSHPTFISPPHQIYILLLYGKKKNSHSCDSTVNEKIQLSSRVML